MRILQRAPQSYPRSACPVPAQRVAHHFPRHRALRLHRESASGCRAAEDFGERREFAVLDDATRTTAVCSRAVGRSPRASTISHLENGPASTRRAALKRAEGRLARVLQCGWDPHRGVSNLECAAGSCPLPCACGSSRWSVPVCSDLSSSNPVAHKGTHKYVRSARVANERYRSR